MGLSRHSYKFNSTNTHSMSSRLKRMKFSSYSEYLKSARWKRFKLRYFKSRRKVCSCGSTSSIQLHHKTYVRLGREKFSDVKRMCYKCHKKYHKNKRKY